ncbi:carboxyl-terminal processing protease [Symbiobacterium terraclitae]|uniref:Carboxyl-terminal processing protease n=1 Tax=Symbiobacterium terraclitae TaxID=557451 RepID=A0ABS4JR28_9FIRM|nr:carboxyl-terminal processing protease [Symbiobacterium terraclitae]
MDDRRTGFARSLGLVAVASVISVVSYAAGALGLIPWANHQVSRLVERVPQTNEGARGLQTERLEEVMQAIQSQYVEEVEPETLNVGALRGMVQALGDRYSAYFTPKEFSAFVQGFEPTFSGIGVTVEISQKTGLLTVVSPIKGSPGEQAGLRTGDAIVEVDGKDIVGMSLEEAVALIKGPKGTQVKIAVKREGERELLHFTITRDTITVPVLDYKMLDTEAGIGYLQLFEFSKKGTADQVKAAIADLRSQGMKRLIFDVRQNPGGLLDEVVEVASLFVKGGDPVVHIVERGKPERALTSTGTAAWDLPLVVLIDGGSASASEILAGAVKDTRAGTLIGEKTFGKGSVQTFWKLKDGSGIKLTTAKYLTAGRKSIDGVGIEPDIVVPNPDRIYPGHPGDPQLEAAVRHIKAMTR